MFEIIMKTQFRSDSGLAPIRIRVNNSDATHLVFADVEAQQMPFCVVRSTKYACDATSARQYANDYPQPERKLWLNRDDIAAIIVEEG